MIGIEAVWGENRKIIYILSFLVHNVGRRM